MTVLLVQTFLLLLGAFLLGASLACFLRRAFASRQDDYEPIVMPSPALTGAASPEAVNAAASSLETDRFGRALAGGVRVPPVFQGPITGPVVEVQEPPASAAPPVPPAAAPPAPTPKAEAPPPVAVEKPAPAPAARPAGPTYTEIAAATVTAAAAAAVAAKARAEQEAAEKKAKADAEAAKAPPPPPPAPAAPAPAPAAQPAAATAAPPSPAPDVQGDDLTRIHSIDAALKDRLYRLGVRTFAAIAAWTPDDLRIVGQSLGFQARILEENWIEQAKILAKGGDPSAARPGPKKPALDVVVPVGADRLHRIIGIDPASEAHLYAHGVTRLAQIAAWTPEDAAKYEGLLHLQEGRVGREGWVDQARFLTRGGEASAPAPHQPAAAQGSAAPITALKATTVTVAAVPSSPPPASDASAQAAAKDGLTGLRSVKSEAFGGGAATSYSSDRVDDLKRIRGIGVLIEKKLNSMGITAYEQVANWTGADIDRISQLLDFKGRIERENWIEQARILASGGQTEFSRRVDRGEA